MEKFKETVEKITGLDSDAMSKAKERQDNLTKPQGSLGVLEDISIQLAGITGNPRPTIQGKKVNIIMASDHGVVEEGVSAFPKDVTWQMVANFVNGGAAINVLSRFEGAEVRVVDIGVDSDNLPDIIIKKKIRHGTANMAKGPAMSRDEAIKAIEAGIDVVENEIENGAFLFSTGEMGIGNTTPSSAILSVFGNIDPSDAVGYGTGINDKALSLKADVIRRAIEINKPNVNDPIDVLSKVGGLDLAGLTGCILGAAAHRKPILIDGFISTAAALIAYKIKPEARNYMIASHVSAEKGHKMLLDLIGIKPMLHMNMRLGEGTGAVLAMNLVEASTRIINEMATFEEAGVSN